MDVYTVYEDLASNVIPKDETWLHADLSQYIGSLYCVSAEDRCSKGMVPFVAHIATHIPGLMSLPADAPAWKKTIYNTVVKPFIVEAPVSADFDDMWA